MVINWPEIGIVVALNGVFLLGLLVLGFRYVRKRLFPQAEQWMGGAIGRFMQNLADQAAEEEGGSSSGSPAGALELGGFKIDPQLIKLAVEYGPQLLELAKQFGLIKGGGGGSNPFLTP